MLVTISCKEHKTSYEHPNNSATNKLEFITKGIVKEFGPSENLVGGREDRKSI